MQSCRYILSTEKILHRRTIRADPVMGGNSEFMEKTFQATQLTHAELPPTTSVYYILYITHSTTHQRLVEV